MRSAPFASAASAVTLALLVSACGGGGGGGVGSTPKPAPSPAPAPAPAPAPTPSPTPPPTGTNDDLFRPLESETFANIAVTGSASYPKNGSAASKSAGAGNVTFSYDRATNSYTVTSGNRTQTFRNGDKDAGLSNSQIDVYVRGNDSLTLSRPGNSGALTYRYVGSGYFQRTTETSTSISATVDAFVYGMPTPSADLRRTGAATYSADLQAVIAYNDAPTSLIGTGDFLIDFETQDINYSGTYDEFLSTTGEHLGIGYWDGSARLSSSSNSFTGTMRIGPFVGPSEPTLTGMFFGPDSNEYGATFHYNGATSGDIAITGTLMGRHVSDRPTSKTDTDLVSLTKDTWFKSLFSGETSELDPATGLYLFNRGLGAQIFPTWTASSHTFTVGSDFGKPDAAFSFDDTDIKTIDDRFTTYEIVNGNTTSTLQLYRPAGSNMEMALTYTGLGHFTVREQPDAYGREIFQDNWFVYTLPAVYNNSWTVPTTGKATYTGLVYGLAIPNLQNASLGSLSGSAIFNFDFGAQTFTGNFKPVATLFSDGSTVNLGTYVFEIPYLAASDFNAQINGPNDDLGFMNGFFAGPNAAELGANFHVDTYATPAKLEYGLRGAIIGKKN